MYNRDFLKELDLQKNKTIYARISTLQFNESPIESVEGKVTGGSVNIDGASSLRRSCSLSMVAEEVNIHDYYWGLNTKFKLEIGVENTINKNYEDIIWFPQGIYVITSFGTALSTTGYNINISGKDKMCLLNGEVGGSINSSVDFGQIDEIDEDSNVKTISYPIKDIIRDSVHQYGNEPFHNIVINDLEDMGLELLEYRYDVPMFLFREVNDDTYFNGAMTPDLTCWLTDGTKSTVGAQDTNGNYIHSYDSLVNSLTELVESTEVYLEDPALNPLAKRYCMAKVDYGETAGYRSTPLTYPGELVANVGEPLTSILDKIVNMLGNFEYFYDLQGRFVFQKKKTYVNTSHSPIVSIEDGGSYVEGLAYSTSVSYSFNGSELITAFNNTPNLNNLKNDYSVWGIRTSATGSELPVHIRYAIDEKPRYYKAFDGKMYLTDRKWVEDLKQQAKDKIKNEFYTQIYNFKTVYPIPTGLQAPEKLDDGSWTAGWWDIRDWFNYYTLLTGEAPGYTMKWYSRNDLSGCVKASDLMIPYDRTITENMHVWLLIRNPKTGKFNPQHGNGNPAEQGSNCTLYQSYYTDQAAGSYETKKVLDENGNVIKKFFMNPYRGCNDQHTYINFIENDVKKQGNAVYFYNPAFPSYESYEDLVSDRIDKEYEEYEKLGLLNYVDWRELIYQMALDYRKHNRDDNFAVQLIQNHKQYSLYSTGMTGYEQYYIDMEGFWRGLYYPNSAYQTDCKKLQDKITEFQTALQMEPNSAVRESLAMRINSYTQKLDKLHEQIKNYYTSDESYPHWNKIVYTAPDALNFWFDFLDEGGALHQFSCKMMGSRPKAVNDKDVKAIYFRETPTIIFTSDLSKEEIKPGYRYFYTSQNYDTMFSISAQGKSARDELDTLLYNHSYCIESVNITSVPVYYLEPNTRVYVFDEKTGIEGDYIISRMTLPLTYNGTMSITATKAPERLL